MMTEKICENIKNSQKWTFEIKMAFEIKWPTAPRKFLRENASISYDEIRGIYSLTVTLIIPVEPI
jgi:hypothetical protein